MSQTLTDMEILVLYNECDEQDRADGMPVVNPGLVRKALADLEEARAALKETWRELYRAALHSNTTSKAKHVEKARDILRKALAATEEKL